MGNRNPFVTGVRRLPFTLLGLLSTALLVGGSFVFEHFGRPPFVLHFIWNALILPAYLTMLVTVNVGIAIFGSHEAVPTWFSVIEFPLRLVPFVLADAMRRAFR